MQFPSKGKGEKKDTNFFTSLDRRSVRKGETKRGLKERRIKTIQFHHLTTSLIGAERKDKKGRLKERQEP